MKRVGFILLLMAVTCLALPVPPEVPRKKKKGPPGRVPEGTPMSEDRRDEYRRYIDELINELGADPEVRRELEKMTPEDLHRLMELPGVGNHEGERTPQEEDWRDDVEEQRRIQRHRFDKENDIAERPDGFGMNDFPDHEADLQRRLEEQNRRMMENEKMRHDQFVQHEMAQEHERRQKLKSLNEKDRLEADEKHQAEVAKARSHPKVPMPGSKHQLEETWEDEGFDPDTFNEETFFHLHDHNEDGVLDAGELEAMLVNEVEKLHHDRSSPEYHEELMRMRQHVVHEVDRNKDGMVSMEEFLASTKMKSYAEDDAWKGIDDEDDYTDEEFDEYEKMMAEEEEREHQMMQDGEHARNQPGHAQPLEDNNINQGHHDPAPGHHEQQPPQHHEQQPPQHLEQQPPQHHEQQPPQHHEQQPPQHHEQQPPQQHEQQPPQQHEQQPPQHHEQQPPQHHEQPPQHHEQQPPQHHEQQPPQHHEQQPPQHHEQQPPQHQEQPQQPQQHHEPQAPHAAT